MYFESKILVLKSTYYYLFSPLFYLSVFYETSNT